MKDLVETLLVETKIFEANDLIGRCALEVGQVYDLEITAKRILALLVPNLADLASLDFQDRRIAVACGVEDYLHLLPKLRSDVWDGFESLRKESLTPITLRNDSPLLIEIESKLGQAVHTATVIPIQDHGYLTLIHMSHAPAFTDLHMLERIGHFLNSILSERAASEADRSSVIRRDILLSIASHDLKTPLTALQLQIQLLRSLEHNPDSRSRLFNLINRSVKTLGDCIGSLSSFGQIQKSEVSLRRTRFDLSALVQEVLERLELILASSKIEVIYSPSGAVVGEWDQPKVDRIISNLLANAAKYAPGAPVEISVEQTEDVARLSFRDHGPGIPPAELEKVFDCYHRVTNTSNREGLGLGLYISRSILLSHGGTLRVENAEGGGARFILELPLIGKEGADV